MFRVLVFRDVGHIYIYIDRVICTGYIGIRESEMETTI